MAGNTSLEVSKNLKIQGPTNRNFGLTVGGVLLGIVVVRLLFGHFDLFSQIILGIGVVLIALVFIAPKLLDWPNKAWMGLGILLGLIVTPILLGFMFFVLLTPLAVVRRMGGNDVLGLKMGGTDSYWKRRDPPSPDPATTVHQY